MVPWLVKQAEYGEMTTLSMGTKTWVLLNSSRVSNEIISRRAATTHERPYFPVAGGLVSRDKRLFLQKTDDWREGRRLLHQLLMGASARRHGEVAEAASAGLLAAYLDEPTAWYAHHYRYAVAVMNKIVTGRPLRKARAELQDLQDVTSSFLTCINSSFAEFFPQLNLLPRPLQLWRPHWEAMGAFHYDVFRRWWAGMTASDADAAPGAEPNFVRDAARGRYSGSEDQAMYLTMLAIVAGADNPRMTMNAGVMACLAYPDAMARAREELERVCGAGSDDEHGHDSGNENNPGADPRQRPLRLPNLDDLPNCPYTCAFVKEVLRWRPTVPLVPQRVAVEDFDFEGYRFPAGTEFLVNSIPVCAEGYEGPGEFRPERWLDQEAASAAAKGQGKDKDGSGVEQDLWQFAFSGGRRSCVGYKLAQKELFVTFARLLYCFDISPAGAFSDRELNAFRPGEPFPVRAAVRGPAHERLIRDEAAKTDLWGS